MSVALFAELDGIAEDLILVDSQDEQALRALRARFQRLVIAAEVASQADAAQAARVAVDALAPGHETDAEWMTRALTVCATQVEVVRGSLAAAPPEAANGSAMDDFLARSVGLGDELSGFLVGADQGDGEALASFRRVVHTLKGDAGMLGLSDMGKVCHQLEEAVSDAHNLALDPLLKTVDWIAQWLDHAAGRPADPSPVAAVIAWLQAAQQRSPGTDRYHAAPAGTSRVVVTQFRSAAESESSALEPLLVIGGLLPAGTTPDMASEFLSEAQEHLDHIEGLLLGFSQGASVDDVSAVFRHFHTLKSLASFLRLTREQAVAEAAAELLDRLRNGSLLEVGLHVEVLFAAVASLRGLLAGLAGAVRGGMSPDSPDVPQVIARLRQEATGGSHPSKRPLGRMLVDHGAVSSEAMQAALNQQTHLTPELRLGEILVDSGQLSSSELVGFLAHQREDGVAVGRTGAAVSAAMSSSMRIDGARVDVLNEAIGELVIAQTMLSCAPELRSAGSRRVQVLLNRLDRVTRQIQDMAMRLRLVSIQPVFQRMLRLGRDAARKVDKDILIVTEGEDLEIDKSVVDRLGEPLVHLMRNACDHGIESDPEARVAAGKPRQGRILLRAFRSAGCVSVSVCDDGKGLDQVRIMSKARERGLVHDEHNLTEQEIFGLIFLPGFSTAEKITDVSGRGVGMDVVKRMVEDVRGTVDLHSVFGVGTTITITLPLTLSIVDGMVVAVGQVQYVIPTLAVVTTLQPDQSTLGTVCGRGQMLTFQDRQIPLFRARDLFDVEATPSARPLVVVIEDAGRRLGLVVDAALGRQQVVVKPMSGGLATVPGIGGSTINGDGRACLVLDIPGLFLLVQD